MSVAHSVIACDKREAFAQGSVATKQSIHPRMPSYGMLCFARNDVDSAARTMLSYPRRRVSSTPRFPGSIIGVSGILGHPLSRVTTTEYMTAISRRIAPELC